MEKPLPHSTRYKAFTPYEASILSAVEKDDPRVCSVPPVKPKGGDESSCTQHVETMPPEVYCANYHAYLYTFSIMILL